MKKLLSLLLVGAMICALLCVSALAAGQTITVTEKDGNTELTSMTINNVAKQEQVTVLNESTAYYCSGEATVTIGGKTTYEKNGKTHFYDNSHMAYGKADDDLFYNVDALTDVDGLTLTLGPGKYVLFTYPIYGIVENGQSVEESGGVSRCFIIVENGANNTTQNSTSYMMFFYYYENCFENSEDPDGERWPSLYEVHEGTENNCTFLAPVAEAERPGYSFKGWSLEENAAAAVYQPGDSITVTKDTTFYAVWEKKAANSIAGLNNFTPSKEYVGFEDVRTEDWFYKNVRTAYNYGLMVGSSATQFNVKGNVSVAEAITMAARLHSIYNTGSENFVQSGGAWYQVYVDYAKANSILSHNYDSLTRSATRAEFAEIFASALPGDALPAINDVTLGAIPDISSTADYAAAVYQLYRAGILSGSDSKGTFNPGSTISRAEAAAIVTRMANTDLRVSVNLTT